MNVYWLEQVTSNVPDDNSWLSADEILHLNAFRFRKRRADWRLGRWTAKQAVACYLALPGHPELLATLEVRPLPSGAPQVFVGNQPAHLTISLSHRAGTALCFVAQLDAKLGCDLELIEPHSEGFIADYFTPEEQRIAAETPTFERIRTVSLLWSAKESALKALQEGLRADPRTALVCPRIESLPPGQWKELEVRYTEDRVFTGWWRYAGDLVRTIVADPSPNLPIHLPSSAPMLESTPQSESTSVAHGEPHKPRTMLAGPSP